jgi:hypothetical protein
LTDKVSDLKEYNMREHLKGIIISSFIVFMLACATTPVSITSSNTPLNDKRIAENLGKVDGKSDYCFAVFGLWMIGKPDIQAAIDNALNKKKADALINIKCYEDWKYFLFVSFTRVIVEGEAIKFQKQSEYVEPY